MAINTAVILVGHGSPEGRANELFLQVARLVQQRGCCRTVSADDRSQGRPTVSEAIDDWQAGGGPVLGALSILFCFPVVMSAVICRPGGIGVEPVPRIGRFGGGALGASSQIGGHYL